MKHFYLMLLFAGSICLSSHAARQRNLEIRQAPAFIDESMLRTPATTSSIDITDLESQVYGRYSCYYFSMVVDPETQQPYGDSYEQPMIVQDYFAETDGDVNVGYLYVMNAILKGHVDAAGSTISIAPKFVLNLYDNPNDEDDPGTAMHFVSVDIVDGRAVPNFTEPWTGTFELYDGKITRITSDKLWGYVALDQQNNVLGWFELARDSKFYLGKGEMEYTSTAGGTEETVQLMVHATSNGSRATIYNFGGCGYDTPVTLDLNEPSLTATMSNQNVTMTDGTDASIVEASNFASTITANVRDVDWDIDYREPGEKTVMTFPTLALRNGTATVATLGSPKVFFKENVFTVPVGVTEIEGEQNGAPSYYNLQGMRVSEQNLRPGIYVRHHGGKAEKIVVR